MNNDRICGRIGCTEPAADRARVPGQGVRIVCEDCARNLEVMTRV